MFQGPELRRAPVPFLLQHLDFEMNLRKHKLCSIRNWRNIVLVMLLRFGDYESDYDYVVTHLSSKDWGFWRYRRLILLYIIINIDPWTFSKYFALLRVASLHNGVQYSDRGRTNDQYNIYIWSRRDSLRLTLDVCIPGKWSGSGNSKVTYLVYFLQRYSVHINYWTQWNS